MVLYAFMIPLVEVLCGVTCLVFMRLSKGLLLAGAGFMGVAFFSFLNGVTPRLLRATEAGDFKVETVIHIVLYLFIIVMYLLVAGGLAMTFMDVQKRLAIGSREPFDPRDRPFPPQAREPFQPRQEGSHDIQP
jgi:hypothetical protein